MGLLNLRKFWDVMVQTPLLSTGCATSRSQDLLKTELNSLRFPVGTYKKQSIGLYENSTYVEKYQV
jgi:hypothetical protein